MELTAASEPPASAPHWRQTATISTVRTETRMHRLLLFATVLCLGIFVACAHAPTEAQKSPKGVVEQFYKMETQGRWLGPERWDELQDFLTDISPWLPNASVSVLKSYEVYDARKDIGAGGQMVGMARLWFFSTFFYRSNCLRELNSILYPHRITSCHRNTGRARQQGVGKSN